MQRHCDPAVKARCKRGRAPAPGFSLAFWSVLTAVFPAVFPAVLLAMLFVVLPAVAHAGGIADAPGVADAPSNEDPASELWAGASLGWDLRAEAISLFKRYTLEDRGAWFSGQGVGGAASLSLHFRTPPALSQGALRWLEFELGIGNATHLVSWEQGEGARPRTRFVDNQTAGIFGVHFGSGRWRAGDGPWSGAVLGVAWVPTYVHFFGSDDFASGGKLNHAGLRLTIDWGRISPLAKGRVPGLRASLTWLPYVGTLPTVVSAGLGCVFY